MRAHALRCARELSLRNCCSGSDGVGDSRYNTRTRPRFSGPEMTRLSLVDSKPSGCSSDPVAPSAEKGTFAFVSLGCPKNLVDSERMLGKLAQQHTLVPDAEGADVVVVNTCGF